MRVGLRKTPEKLMSCQVFGYAYVLPFRNLVAASPHYNVVDSGVTPGKEL